jgi:hypothetical protein
MFYARVISGLLFAALLLIMLIPVDYSDTTGMQVTVNAV